MSTPSFADSGFGLDDTNGHAKRKMVRLTAQRHAKSVSRRPHWGRWWRRAPLRLRRAGCRSKQSFAAKKFCGMSISRPNPDGHGPHRRTDQALALGSVTPRSCRGSRSIERSRHYKPKSRQTRSSIPFCDACWMPARSRQLSARRGCALRRLLRSSGRAGGELRAVEWWRELSVLSAWAGRCELSAV